MTTEDFIKKYKGKGIDYDGSFGNQCVDLYRQYVKEVLSLPQSSPVQGAKDIWDKYLKEYFERHNNTPTTFPKKGDIVIWGRSYGPFGHVAICTEANAKNFSCFSQNDPANTLCQIKKYSSYKGVLGWLRKKTDIMQSDMSPIWVRQMFLELGLDIDKPEGEVRGRVQEVIDGFKKYGELQDKVTKLEKEVAFQIGEAAKHEQESVQFAKTIASLQDELSDLRHAITQRDIDISKLQTTVQTLQDQIDPTKVIIVRLEDYQKLTSTNGLRAYTTINLFVELIKRIVVRRKI